MAKTEFFRVGAPAKVSKTDALANAQIKDARNANFHIPAETDEILTFTGDFYESEWTREENGKVASTGTMLLAEMTRENGIKVYISFSFLRDKELLQEDGLKTFKAVFSRSTTFETIVNGLKKDDKFKVCRGSFVYPGRSSSRDIDTLVRA